MSRYQASAQLDCKVYVGGLTRNASREEIERAFGHYGKTKNVFVARNPPGFAFIEYEDPQDAEDAVRALDGRVLCGVRVRVEMSHGKSRSKGPFKRNNDSNRRRRSRSFERNKRRNSFSRSSSRSRGGGGGGERRENGRDRYGGGDRNGGDRRRIRRDDRSRSRS